MTSQTSPAFVTAMQDLAMEVAPAMAAALIESDHPTKDYLAIAMFSALHMGVDLAMLYPEWVRALHDDFEQKAPHWDEAHADAQLHFSTIVARFPVSRTTDPNQSRLPGFDDNEVTR